MNESELKAILERKELNKSGIADLLYPNNNFARTALNNKLSGKRKLTAADLAKAWEVLKDLAEDIMQKAPTKE